MDYIHYYIGCKMIRSSHWEPQNEPYILDFKNIAEAIEFDDRPVLRQLEDMTQDEAAHLALIYSGAKTVEITKGIAANWHYFICHFGEDQECEILTIGSDGCAWYAHYFDKKQPGHRNIVDEHKAFHYLLQHHFDLFGLIPAGLAIDAKTIK